MYSNGYATKHDYARALKGYQAYVREIKSDDGTKLLHLMMNTNTMMNVQSEAAWLGLFCF